VATEAAWLKCKTSHREEKEKPTGHSPAFSWKDLAESRDRFKVSIPAESNKENVLTVRFRTAHIVRRTYANRDESFCFTLRRGPFYALSSIPRVITLVYLMSLGVCSMIEQTSTRCLVCEAKLQSEKERNMDICFKCRIYGLLNGCWPETERISVLPDRT
jgi:hypothetical protein